jgi:DNA-binding CsgD family transcriptional regulator
VTTTQLAVLDAVGSGVRTTREIASLLCLSYSAVEYSLGALHTKGHVARKPEGATFTYFLTAKAGS